MEMEAATGAGAGVVGFAVSNLINAAAAEAAAGAGVASAAARAGAGGDWRFAICDFSSGAEAMGGARGEDGAGTGEAAGFAI